MNRKNRRHQEKHRKKNPKPRPQQQNIKADSGGTGISQEYASAALHLKAGRVKEAASLCALILQKDPFHPGALHFLGIMTHMEGENVKAVDLIGRAIACGGADFSFHVNLGNALRALRRFEEAKASYLRARQMAPGIAEIHNNLGALLNDLGKPDEAAQSCRSALAINNHYPEAYYNLGNALSALLQNEEAQQCFRQAIKLKPSYHDAHFNLGRLLLEAKQLDLAKDSFLCCIALDPQNAVDHNHLGISMFKLGDLEGAAGSFRRAIDLDPNQVEALNNLSKVYKDQGLLNKAVDAGRQARAIRPDLAEVHNTLGAALSELGEFDEAMDCFNKALELDFGQAAAHLNLGNVLRKQGRFDEALARYRKALQINPGFAGLHEGLSCALLSEGKLEEGWKEFEWRATLRSFGGFTDKVWQGEDLSQKTILVWPEQGIGDQIMFANCLPDVIKQAKNCIIEIDRRLVLLFKRSFPKALVHGGYEFTGSHQVMREGFEWLADYPPVDYFSPLGSLPRFLRPSLESFPEENAFLKANPERAAYWQEKVKALGTGPKIAVSWRSLLMNKMREIKYPPLECWAPLFAVPGAVFINAQAGFLPEELDEIEKRFAVRLHTFDEINLRNDLDDTAAMLLAVDFVVSADTYLPMMAGGLGVPAWRITRGEKKQDWSFLGAEKYPWFSSLTVRFGVTPRELLDVFQQIAGEAAGEVNCASQKMMQARSHHQEGRLAEAEKLYSEAILAAPLRADAHANLALVLERSSRVDEASLAALEALRLKPANVAASLVLAKCEARSGAPQQALARLEALSQDQLTPIERAQVSSEMGILCDRLLDFSRAYELFVAANGLRAASEAAKKIDRNIYLREIAVLKARFSAKWVSSWTKSPGYEEGQKAPVFLVGFPRSGTTLLGRILKAHPKVEMLEERPLFKTPHERMNNYPDCLASLSPAGIQALRHDYFNAVREYLAAFSPLHTLVDKMPLNLVEAGLIHRLFPDARFLLALRHPADVCLSCFMQDFQINRALIHFDSLEHSVHLYGQVMELWLHFASVLGLLVLPVRYEDLANGPKQEIMRILQFLELPFDDAVINFAGAKSTSDIRAPSYHQVSEPIHGRSINRWRNYAKHMRHLIPELAPFAKAFGYDVS